MATALPRSPILEWASETTEKHGILRSIAEVGSSVLVAALGVFSSIWLFFEAIGWSL